MLTSNTTKDILIADDDQEDVDVFKVAVELASTPANVRVAADGAELFRELDAAVPHMLFLDIEMPCKDGLSCILEIRQNNRYDRMPVIMLTSHARKLYIDTTFRTGANYYMVKTSSMIKLTKKLEYLLSIKWEDQIHYPPREQFVLD